MMMHAMNCEKDNDIDAESTLIELIDNNTDVLENRIQPQVIYRFINALLSADKNPKYVKLLIALVNCEGFAVKGNQSEISTMLFNEKNASKVLYKLEMTKART